MRRIVFLYLFVFLVACTSTRSNAGIAVTADPDNADSSGKPVPTSSVKTDASEGVNTDGAQTSEGVESQTEWPTEGWQTSTPEEQGINSEPLINMLVEIEEQDFDIDSVSIVRNGYLVLDVAVFPFRSDSRHIIHSCTKSIVSTLIGIALDKGLIESVDQPVVDFFSYLPDEIIDASKETITLENLLTMSSGLECRDSYLYNWSGLSQMRQSQDWVEFVLGLSLIEEPGTRFEYCNGGSFLLSAIIQETTGKSALAFAEEFLFGPMGITDIVWPTNPQGINIGWGEIRMQPKDLAKIGYLFLNDGEWDGQQLISSEWVAAATRKHISGTLQDGYGYQWWVTTSAIYMALGYAGQYLVIAPDLNTVIVITSNLGDNEFYVPQQIIERFVIPAVESSMPLMSNPEAFNALQSQIDALSSP